MNLSKIRVVADKVNTRQVLFKCSSPIAYGWEEPEGETEFVLVSAVCGVFANETYVFPCTEQGDVLNWLELPGSHKHGMNIALAVERFENAYD